MMSNNDDGKILFKVNLDRKKEEANGDFVITILRYMRR